MKHRARRSHPERQALVFGLIPNTHVRPLAVFWRGIDRAIRLRIFG
jgi:hypothetical protein